MNCQQQAELISAIAAAIITLNVLSFFGWRRLTAPWRTAAFVVFAVTTLLIVDYFVLVLAYSAQPPTPQTGQVCR